MGRQRDDRVPDEVEEYLVGVGGDAGALGGRITSDVVGLPRSRMMRRGRRGGERGTRRVPTRVAERSGPVSGSPEQVLARATQAMPTASILTDDPQLKRFAATHGWLSIPGIVVELAWPTAPDGADQLRLRVYAKEGLARRGLAERLADEAWSAVTA